MTQQTLNSKAATTTSEMVFLNTKIQLNDVFYSSWGYDQTNVNFYQVVGIRGKSTLVLREIKSEDFESQEKFGMTGEKTPLVNDFKNDVLITRRFLKHFDRPAVRIDCSEIGYFMDYVKVFGVKLYTSQSTSSYC